MNYRHSEFIKIIRIENVPLQVTPSRIILGENDREEFPSSHSGFYCFKFAGNLFFVSGEQEKYTSQAMMVRLPKIILENLNILESSHFSNFNASFAPNRFDPDTCLTFGIKFFKFILITAE